MSSVKEVARLANVSSATVSRVINNDPAVKPETRDISEITYPRISTVSQPMHALGYTSVQMMVEMLQSGGPDNRGKPIYLPHKLVIRGYVNSAVPKATFFLLFLVKPHILEPWHWEHMCG